MSMAKNTAGILFCILPTLLVSACTLHPTQAETSANASGSTEIIQSNRHLSGGTIIDRSGYTFEDALDPADGAYANFYVENLGGNPIVASVYLNQSEDPSEEATLQPGESGQISIEVTQGFWGSHQDYKFTIVPGKNGGTVHADYNLNQSPKQSAAPPAENTP